LRELPAGRAEGPAIPVVASAKEVPFMLTRRLFCGCLAAVTPFAATAAHAQSECAVFTQERQKNTTPDQAVALLKQGNERLLAGKPTTISLPK
jgi:carbonic anhydrase